MNEVKLRLAIRDLYRGDGGPLNDLDQGWNDGVDAAAEIFSAENAALAEMKYLQQQRPLNLSLLIRLLRLRKEVEALRDKLRQAQYEIDAMKVDAERYRWLRERSHDTAIGTYEWVKRNGRQQRVYLAFDELDAAIDAALRDAGVKT